MPTYAAMNAVFGGALPKRTVVTTWTYNGKKYSGHNLGQWDRIEAHYNAVKMHVELHGVCSIIDDAIAIGWKPRARPGEYYCIQRFDD